MPTLNPTPLAPPSLFRRLVLALSASTNYRNAAKFAPSADRNKVPIGDALSKYAPFARTGSAVADLSTCCLEIASGSGQHADYLSSRYPHVVFQPTEYAGGSSGPEEKAYGDLSPVFASIVCYTGGRRNVRAPIALDAAAAVWPDEVEEAALDAVYAANVCHISPIAVTDGIFAASSRLLAADGKLFIYGPFMVDGQHTTQSNADFDARLKSQDASWGVRDSTSLAEAASSKYGLTLIAREEMPSNNFLLVFGRDAGQSI